MHASESCRLERSPARHTHHASRAVQICSLFSPPRFGSAADLWERAPQGYERFWEARKIWENVQNKCRNMARIVTSYVVDNDDDLVLKVLQILTAYPYALKQHLRSALPPHTDSVRPVGVFRPRCDDALARRARVCMPVALRVYPSHRRRGQRNLDEI